MRRLRRKVLGVVGFAALAAGVGSVVTAPTALAAAVVDIAELRAAVDEANADPGNETIDLLSGTVYAITGDECNEEFEGDDDDANAVGDLDVILVDDSLDPQDLTIQTASGAPAIIEVSCPLTRAIEVVIPVNDVTVAENPNVGTLTLSNVIVRGGRAPDDTSSIPNDGVAGNGGGVFAPLANLVFNEVIFEDNRAGDGGGGNDDIPNGELAGSGGAVALVGGTITATGSTFTNNHAGAGGTGWTNTCDVPFEIPAGNGGNGGSGGAILAAAVTAPIELSIETSTFSGNSAGNGGDGGDGTPAACNVPGFGGSGGRGGDGGAIFVSQRGATFSIGHSAFAQNAAGDGGAGGDGAAGQDAVQQQGDVNAAAAGGSGGAGGFAGDGGSGGGVANFDSIRGNQAEPTPDRVIANSTFDSNASGNGGAGGNGGNGGAGSGQDPQGFGGDGRDGGCGGNAGAITDTNDFCQIEEEVGIEQVEGALALVHLTVTENGGGGAGGAAGSAGAGGGTDGAAGTSVGGSISSFDLEAIAIVVGTSTEDANDCNYPEIVGGPLFASSSFSTDDSCGFGDGSVQPFTSFALTPLGDHGGPTATRVPQTGSLLIDAEGDCTAADDQRAVGRPIGPGCDVGAVEVGLPVTLAVTKTPSAASVPVGGTVVFTITVKNTGTGTPAPGVTLVETNCSTPESLTGGDANSNGTLDPNETWTYTCTATPPALGTFTNVVTATVTDPDNLPVSAQATANVNVVAAEEIARTGMNMAKWTGTGLSLIATGFALLVFGPVSGRHVRRRRPTRYRAC